MFLKSVGRPVLAVRHTIDWGERDINLSRYQPLRAAEAGGREHKQGEGDEIAARDLGWFDVGDRSPIQLTVNSGRPISLTPKPPPPLGPYN